MATIKGISVVAADMGSTSPVPPIPPDPPDPDISNDLLTTTRKNMDLDLRSKSANMNKLKILHVREVALECNYNMIATSFEEYGQVNEIRMNLTDDQLWEVWIIFDKYEEAFNACQNIGKVLIYNRQIKGALTDKVPKNMYAYKPSEWNSITAPSATLNRSPKPPKWLIASAKENNFNYYRFSKHIQKLVGGIKSGDISRFGKGKVLIHTQSYTQSVMLSNMNVTNDNMIKDIKPHINFSYGRGVVFDKDLYEFDESEILDMSPPSIYKVRKIPRTSMIVLSFEDANIPSHVVFENERVRVRPFHPKPLQCFNCYKFGHSSNTCTSDKICGNCAMHEHGICQAAPKCTNCMQDHKSTDKSCLEYKIEEAALHKANAEHITIGYAKQQLRRSPTYAAVLRNPNTSPTSAPTTTAPTADGAAVGTMPTTRSSRPSRPTPPTKVGVSPSREALLPTEMGSPPPRSSPPITDHSPIFQTVSQAESLPDLREHDQGPKRGRSPSHSPPHVRPKPNSPQSRYDKDLKITAAEIHPSNQKRKSNDISKNRPMISRNSKTKSNK